MSLTLSMPTVPQELKPRITVIGVGGAGGNAVNNMIRSNLEGVEFIVANTDAQALAQSICPRRIQLGINITQGLGAGARPDVGRAAAEEALDEVMENFQGANMVFITAGMGGGTGTGAAPVLARAAREQGILTVGVVTKPFHFEGAHRMRLAESGIEELQQFVDTLLIIPNQNLFRIANEKTTFADAFAMADQVLHSGVRGVTDLMVMPGLINLDFADIRTVMSEMGKAMMGTGEASGENRAVAAAEAAISNPLLDDVSMKGARGVLINITGGYDMTLFEVDEAANRIREEVDSDANIIFGSTFDQNLEGRVRISVVATGIDAALAKTRPTQTMPLSAVSRTRATQGSDSAFDRTQRQPERRPVETRAVEARPVEARRVETRPVEAAPAEPRPVAEPRRSEARVAEAARAGAVVAVTQRTHEAPPAQVPTWSEEMAAPQEVEADMEEAVAEPAHADYYHEADHAELRASEPAPVRSAPPPRSEPRPERAPDPAPVRPAEPRRRGPGIFARVAGTAGAWRQNGNGSSNGEHREAIGPARSAASEPPARVTAVPPTRATSSGGQPRLSGLDARDRLQPSRAEEDVLDIPAFLRRQAN